MAVNVGQGTVLKATISSTLTAIFQLLEIDGPSVEIGAKETTNLTSTAKTYRAQLPDAGELNFSVQYDPADTTSHQFLQTAVMTWPQVAVAWTLNFNTVVAHNWGFSAFVTKFKPKGMNEDDNLEADLSLKVSGAITFT
jgi:hypothetical protein